MKFDFVIGNPPYQDETIGENKGFAPPVYNKFLDAAIEVADKVEMIHPARFLFNAGSTPKDWNEKMLNDPHFKVSYYESDSSKVFSNTDIKGGIVISYRNANENYGRIGIFSPYKELNTILKKVPIEKSIKDISITSYAYHFTEKMHNENPEIRRLQSKGHEYDLKSNIFDRLPMIFFDKDRNDGSEYVQIVGRSKNERVVKFIKREYINNVFNFDKYKIFIPKASGVGAFGESLGPSIIVGPNVGHTETFFSIGAFDSELEAQNALKYIKTKFSRALLSVLKTTQNMTPGNWQYVPLQDFSVKSDIDWTLAITGIDKQLYKKYGLSEEEIDFIETNVKEME